MDKLILRKYRFLIAMSLIIIIPLGLGTKIYQGTFAWWFHGYAGAIFYEIFWMLLIAFIYPYFSITIAAAK